MKNILLVLILLPTLIHSQKIQGLKIKEARLVYNKDENLFAGKRLPIGIYVQAYKKKADKYKEFDWNWVSNSFVVVIMCCV